MPPTATTRSQMREPGAAGAGSCQLTAASPNSASPAGTTTTAAPVASAVHSTAPIPSVKSTFVTPRTASISSDAIIAVPA